MVLQVQGGFPNRHLVLLGDDADSAEPLLKSLPLGIDPVGRMRSNARIDDPRVPDRPRSQSRAEAEKGSAVAQPQGGGFPGRVGHKMPTNENPPGVGDGGFENEPSAPPCFQGCPNPYYFSENAHNLLPALD